MHNRRRRKAVNEKDVYIYQLALEKRATMNMLNYSNNTHERPAASVLSTINIRSVRVCSCGRRQCVCV